ncbi:MAG: hypothetical protein ABIJ24_05940 [Nitrospinota bacterium]|nr:hypothetical protein [Nitrospinota bacterium]
MRYINAILAINLLLLAGCLGADQHINKLAQEVYSKSTLEEPLPPHEFKSDGCSCWPDSEWIECCVAHDLDYWMGGTAEERKQSDKRLQECVASKGHPLMGKVMYLGVRPGGVYWLPTPFRWGFGWDYPQSGPPGKKY